MGHACEALDTPITGGNISFYNQTLDEAIYPTPIIGMIGILPENVQPPSPGFVKEGDAIVLLGETRDEMGASEYQRTIDGKLEGPLPELDLVKESATGWVIREMISRGQILSAQDCAEGGIWVALAELCIHGHIGAEVTPEPGLDPTHWLFSESASRIVVGLAKADVPEIKSLAANLGTSVVGLGYVKGKSLIVEGLFEINVATLKDVFEGGFPELMG
ncbi:MAG: AIR synthase-related protein [Actinomycetota bacterium]